MDKVYIAIDLKSFYASNECSERGLDPLKTNLVVADVSRTEKTICLAVSPSLKSFGIPGRARLFEVIEKVKQINIERYKKTHGKGFIGKSFNIDELNNNPYLELDFIAATPQMQHYIDVSSKIYSIYLKYISSEDIHVYSIDEVFMDVTSYLNAYKMTPRELAMKMIKDVLKETGITATCGIGTNLYLAKVSMDIVAKHKDADEFGVRIAELDEKSYRRLLWDHKPLTDFWRVGRGIEARLNKYGIYTMGDICRVSINNEDLLYNEFGINAELLIDHAWGIEPCDIKTIKTYKPQNTSLSVGQVLHCGYDYKKGLLIVKEMTDLLCLDLVEKNLYTNQISLYVGYDIENLKGINTEDFNGEIVLDYVGRKVPKPSHGSINLPMYNSSSKIIINHIVKLYEAIVDDNLLIRRINISCHTMPKELVGDFKKRQLDIFTDYDELVKIEQKLKKDLENENKLQKTINDLHKKYGKNSVLKGMNIEDGGTTKDRNNQIGGHRK